MAAVESCRPEIVHANGIVVLLKFLQKRPSLHIDSTAEISACERLQQKSTIALSRFDPCLLLLVCYYTAESSVFTKKYFLSFRLSSEKGVAQLAYNLGGIHRLARLCRRDQERNYSDGVLIAALVRTMEYYLY